MHKLSAFLRAYSSDCRKAPAVFDKILVGNRGEIACRVIRTAKRLGIKTVSIYSDADKGSMHSVLADESYYAGPAPSSESYLKIDDIVTIAKDSEATAVHPGYGFLSENPVFSDSLHQAGIKFIGPGSEAMKSMASKSEAKTIMIAAGLPVIPGYHGDDQSIERLQEEASRIGYPVMIKAVMGGGGKGMRIVESEVEFKEKLESAKRESMKHFSDDRVILEKYIKSSRHIEVQIFADQHGKVVHLFERDCSVQRRHQKILEEAPASGLTEEQRRDLGEKAVEAAKAVNYEGAGTVEFIWDNESGKFYFMEMNTRLQVEHPVTEMITGIDLVQWQLEIASGRPLPLSQKDIGRYGFAVEARVYAENVENNSMPDFGPLKVFQTPTPNDFLRVETGLRQGDNVTVHYDPMIAKVIAFGETRRQAFNKLSQALCEFRVVGVKTNVAFIQRIIQRSDYKSNPVDTSFISDHREELLKEEPVAPEAFVMASLYKLSLSEECGDNILFRSFGAAGQNIVLAGKTLKVSRKSEGEYRFLLDGVSHEGSFSKRIDGRFDLFIDGKGYPNVTVAEHAGKLYLFYQSTIRVLELEETRKRVQDEGNTSGDVRTPMPCRISSVLVKVGDHITKGTTVAVLESMKMEHVVKCISAGVVKAVLVKEGDVVGEGQKLIEFA